MKKKVMVVESPAKARTISSFLDNKFKVVASYGHVRDLPEKRFGVNIKQDFKPTYVVPKGKKKVVDMLKKIVKETDELFIASDEDREGEAIGWHIVETIKPHGDIKRVVFHEITKEALNEAVKNPRSINMDMVKSQEARRILDRIVGYKLSPFLAKKIQRGLSAGRVQSVALKLIVEREKEIEKFKPRQYWTVHPYIHIQNAVVETVLTSIDGRKIGKFDLSEDRTKQIKKDLQDFCFEVTEIKKKEKTRKPNPPFTTSTLQQEASTKLHFSPSKTQTIAQGLYDGKDIGNQRIGLITYMRTDSMSVSGQAQKEAVDFIKKNIGKEFVPPKPNVYKTKVRSAQEAHESIHPTSSFRTPESMAKFLTTDERKLYTLIWNRFLASQMTPAKEKTLTVTFGGNGFEAKASETDIIFPGFLILSEEKQRLPSVLQNIKKGEEGRVEKIKIEEHTTEPPSRYSEASLIKILESYGIGRPSTYASISKTLFNRKYIKLEKRKIYPTELGKTVSNILSLGFDDIINTDFTKKMEEELDEIAQGKKKENEVLNKWYAPFADLLNKAYENIKSLKPPPQPTDKVCELCGAPMVIREGRYGKFLACSNFPKCRNTKPLKKEETDEICEKCGRPMVVKHNKYGVRFLACSGYPKCKNTKPYSIGIKCPQCEKGELTERGSKNGKFYRCSRYPECKFIVRGEIVKQKCPQCKNEFLVKEKKWLKCPKCGWKKEAEDEV